VNDDCIILMVELSFPKAILHSYSKGTKCVHSPLSVKTLSPYTYPFYYMALALIFSLVSPLLGPTSSTSVRS
jgi:hypothetical protein